MIVQVIDGSQVVGNFRVTWHVVVESLPQSPGESNMSNANIAALKAKKDQFSKVEDALFAQVGAETRAEAFAAFPVLCAAIDAELQTGVTLEAASAAIAAIQAEWLALAPEATDVVKSIVALYNLALSFLALLPAEAPPAPAPAPVEPPAEVPAAATPAP